MSQVHYTDEFKIEAVKQVTDQGHSVADVAQRLGVAMLFSMNWAGLAAVFGAVSQALQPYTLRMWRMT